MHLAKLINWPKGGLWENPITATLIDPYYNNQQRWLWQKNEPKRHPTLSDGQTLRSLPLTPIKSRLDLGALTMCLRCWLKDARVDK